jgi:hypothetical protein
VSRAKRRRGPGTSASADRGRSLCRCAPLSQPRSGCVPSAGHDGPLLYPGPLCGGESGSTGRVAGIGMDADAFSPAHGCAVEKPGPGSRTCRPWMGGKRQAGCSFSLVTFSLSTQRESDSVAEGDRPLFALNAAKSIARKRAPTSAGDRPPFALNATRARASRTGCAPTGRAGRGAGRFAGEGNDLATAGHGGFPFVTKRRARLNRRRHLPSRSHSRLDGASSSGIAACMAARIAR